MAVLLCDVGSRRAARFGETRSLPFSFLQGSRSPLGLLVYDVAFAGLGTVRHLPHSPPASASRPETAKGGWFDDVAASSGGL